MALQTYDLNQAILYASCDNGIEMLFMLFDIDNPTS